MSRTHLILTLISGLFAASCSLSPSDSIVLTQLKCNYFDHPVGLEDPAPSFSWVLSSEKGWQEQRAFQVLVASSPELLRQGKADIWDSGKTFSDRSLFNEFKGAPLAAQQSYWWKVRIWNQDGEVSPWSGVQSFQMGLMGMENWRGARWISMHSDERVSEYRSREIQNMHMPSPESRVAYPAAYLRKGFPGQKQVERARLYVAALGYYEAYLNGERIGENVLDPSPSSYDHHSYYVVHDVSEFLDRDANVLGILLGNGFYGQNLAFNADLSYGRPSVMAMLQVDYRDGSSSYILSDSSWQASTGPIVFDNVYAGETYDARYELDGWMNPGYNAGEWEQAGIEYPEAGDLHPQLMPAIKIIDRLKPQKIFRAANGNWILDFGENISGWCRIGVNEKAGQKIRLLYAEALTRKGDQVHPGSTGKFATAVLQEDMYICKGTDLEQWQPRFTYHGFRYVEIEGLSKEPLAENFQAVKVNTAVKEKGHFSCSEPLLNRMAEVSDRSIRGNLHGIPEDCPHREKCGWLGDAHVIAEYCSYRFDMSSFYAKYLDDIRSQLKTVPGGGPGDRQFMVPSMIAPGKRRAGTARLDWGIAAIYLPWYSYLHTGDLSLIEKHYPDMKELLFYYLSFRSSKGIIENGMGDWCPPLWDRISNPGAMQCHPFVSSSAYFYDILKIMQSLSARMGERDLSKALEMEARQLKESFNKQYLETIAGEFKWYGSQTATVMALRFSMVPDSLVRTVVKGLKYDIENNRNGHHSTGIHGSRYIYSVLSDHGEEALSISLLTNPGFPSQAYILNSGMTTWPERQWEWDSGIEWDRSLNHPMHAGFTAFFFETLAGIRPLADHPGYKKFALRPAGFGLLDSAGAELQSPYGLISSKWEIQDDLVLWQVRIPFNTRAELSLSSADPSTVRVNKKPLSSYAPLLSPESIALELGPGSYLITFKYMTSEET